MPKPKKGPRLGSGPSHQRLMLANLAVSLFEHERIQTTEAKAKMLRPYAERLITKAKKGDVHNRRQVLSVIEDRNVVHKLFSEIAPRFSERNGGYTRILKVGPRNGDGAPMALVELLDGEVLERPTEDEEGTEGRSRRGLRRGRAKAAPAAPEAASTETDDELELEDDGAETAGESEAVEEPDGAAQEDEDTSSSEDDSSDDAGAEEPDPEQK